MGSLPADLAIPCSEGSPYYMPAAVSCRVRDAVTMHSLTSCHTWELLWCQAHEIQGEHLRIEGIVSTSNELSLDEATYVDTRKVIHFWAASCQLLNLCAK